MDGEDKVIVWAFAILFGGPCLLAAIAIIADAYIRTH